MTEKICRNCKHWEGPNFMRRNSEIDYSYPCPVLFQVLDIQLETRGWDGYSVVDTVDSPASFGCHKFEVLENLEEILKEE